MFPFQLFDASKVPGNASSLKSSERVGGGNVETPCPFSELEGSRKAGEIDFFSSGSGFHQDRVVGEREVQLISGLQGLDDVHHDLVTEPSQSSVEDMKKFASFKSGDLKVIDSEIPSSFRFPSFGLSEDFARRSRYMNRGRISEPSYDTACTKVSDPKSTIAILSFAGEEAIKCLSKGADDPSLLSNPVSCKFAGLSDEECRNVELVCNLLACAEKVDRQQFDIASKLIKQCDKLSSNKGNPVRRLAYYFCAALKERISKETVGIKYDFMGKKQLVDLRDVFMCANPSILALHKNVPFSRVIQFTGIQTLAENVRGAKKVHIIDTEIRNGGQYTVLMQVLAAPGHNLQHLKITAIGTRSKSKMEDTGKHLMSFAQSMNFRFSFNVVMVADFLDLNVGLFELDDDELVAVYSAFSLSALVAQQDHLDCLMKVMENIKPCVIVMCEVEANHTSPAFLNRFIEAMFYYGAFFDALADCMADVESYRRDLEADIGLLIQNIVATEGTERIIRHISLDVWRAYFARFGLAEADISFLSKYQADLLVKTFNCGSSCTLDMDEECLVIGWKGAPIFSVSAWKFL